MFAQLQFPKVPSSLSHSVTLWLQVYVFMCTKLPNPNSARDSTLKGNFLMNQQHVPLSPITLQQQ